MNRWHLRCSLFAVCVLFASFANALEYKANGMLDRTPQPQCGCDGVPFTCNIGEGYHSCCGCGCAHGGFCNWCGHGRSLGACARSGGLLRCDHARQWYNLYYGGGYGYGPGAGSGYGAGYGYGYAPGAYGAGSGQSWGGYNADLFYNYYAPQTASDGGVPTDMYPSPHATPAPAIQTYYTYQPWLPHEHLYEHNRDYIRYHSGGLGATATHIEWGNSPLRRHKY